jgi:hypothetical protein
VNDNRHAARCERCKDVRFVQAALVPHWRAAALSSHSRVLETETV